MDKLKVCATIGIYSVMRALFRLYICVARAGTFEVTAVRGSTADNRPMCAFCLCG